MAMLPTMSNDTYWSNTLRCAIEQLTAWLPPGWKVALRESEAAPAARGIDGILELTAPDDTVARIVVDLKDRFTAAQAANSIPRLERLVSETGADSALVVARYLSELARTRLRERKVSYIDATGNAWLTLDQPAVWIEGRGADRDPSPPRRGVRSLKGGKAGRIVRALCDWRPPVGVRELAGRAGVDPGYTTRVLSLLTDEDVITRSEDGGIAGVLFSDLLRRWGRDYKVRAAPYLAPRGTQSFLDGLQTFPERYALTGSIAVPPEAEIAPARLIRCYVDDAEAASKALDLTRTDSGANILLLEPPDPVVFERTREATGVAMVALGQCVVDLLTGSGREPNEGESLITWMELNERAWRG